MANIRVTVIKLGGALVARPSELTILWQQAAQLRKTGPIILVHGGGPQATAMAHRLGHEPQFVEGRRITTDLDLQIVAWTMRGFLNASLVAQATSAGLPAVGLCGADGNILHVHKRPPWMVHGKEVDFGWVGDIERLDTTLMDTLLSNGFMPIVAPLGVDSDGLLYNVNADTVAAAIASAMCAHTLLLATKTGGVRRNTDDASTVLATCTREICEEGLQSGWISGGMGVKLQVALDALDKGVDHACIVSIDDLVHCTAATHVVR